MVNGQLPDLCVAILAGGQSRRMGCNKALLVLDGSPLIARLVDQARHLSDQIWICANDPGPYRFLGLPVVADAYAGQGPLAGLHAAMVRSSRPLVLLIACDLPAVREPLLRRLVQAAEAYDAVIPQTTDGRLHPLCGVYRRSCLSALEHNLSRGINKMTDLFLVGSLRLKTLSGDQGLFSDDQLDNLNSPEDLKAFGRRSGPDSPPNI